MNIVKETERHDACSPQFRLLFWKRDVATAIGVSVRTLERMIATGEIPAPDILLRGRHAWRWATVTEWIDNGCPKRCDILDPA